MKRILSLLISCVMLLTGCSLKPNDSISSSNIETTLPIYTTVVESETESLTGTATEAISNVYEEASDLQFPTFDDPELLQYIEDSVYAELVEQLNSDDYIVESVQAVCMPKEYYEEVLFNSQENIYFGYKVSDLNEIFQGTKYIFTVDNNGNTVVQEMEVLYDNSYDQMMKNIVIGASVILICVTVSIVTGGLGLPAVSAVFAASAKTATTFALSSAAIGGASAAFVKGIETRNLKATFKSATLGASDGFKWGAITGAVVGGTSETIKLAKAAKAEKLANDALTKGTSVELGRAGEEYAAQFYGGETQVSFWQGEEVPMGTPNSTRPDRIIRKPNGGVEAIEIKNYNLKNEKCLSKLKNELKRQVIERKTNLPAGSSQRIGLITKGRNYSESFTDGIVKELQAFLYEPYEGTIPIDILT